MIPQLPYLHFARISLENTAPLSIGTGRGDGLRDALIVLDANGLPALPGSSLAGVLRHWCEDRFGGEATRHLFGFTEGTDSQTSRLEVSWGHIHSRRNIPVEGLLQDEQLNDPILKPLLEQPLPMRDGVRLNGRGVAADAGKFDRSYLPPGYRFSFDLMLWDAAASAEWAQLLGAINSPAFRLGGATRRGFGAFKLVGLRAGEFDLRNEDDLKRYSGITASLAATAQSLPETTPLAARQDFHEIRVALTPEEGGFRFGAGSASLGKASGKVADGLPLSEQRIVWENGIAAIAKRREAVIPASSVKGALAHRVAYHYNRLAGLFEEQALVGEKNPAVTALFGFAKNGDEAQAGRVWLDDVYLEVAEKDIKTQMHNSIDRFTGGVLGGALFSEEIVHGQRFVLTLRVAEKQFDGNVLAALKHSLQDLTESRLALGAGAAKGHGYFQGTLDWPDALNTKEGA